MDVRQEPSAAARQMARGLRDYYVALVAEGFSERQAIQLISEVLALAASRPKDDE